MSWSQQQDAALRSVANWHRSTHSEQVFRLFGYAGTGKTTLARRLAEDIKGEVLFAAFTGKAALVMRRKGCGDANTIHKLIYRPFEDKETGELRFVLAEASPIRDASLVIVDECSMIDQRLGRDLLSFGTKVLVLGDPAQLPPVYGAGFFTEVEPDIMLTEVHRQARDNPIIAMSMMVREHGRLACGDYGASRVMPRAQLEPDDVLDADQLLVGTNRTRTLCNQRIRTLNDIDSTLPIAGDRLVCLRNRHDKGLLNGSLWSVDRLLGTSDDAILMQVEPEDAGDTTTVMTHPAFFQGREGELPWDIRRELDAFDFGYALTVHKAQGSQWANVMLLDESETFRNDRARWLYTGITRAANHITVVTT